MIDVKLSKNANQTVLSLGGVEHDLGHCTKIVITHEAGLAKIEITNLVMNDEPVEETQVVVIKDYEFSGKGDLVSLENMRSRAARGILSGKR